MQFEDYLTLVAEFDTLWGKNGSDASRTRMDELLDLMQAFESTYGEAGILAHTNRMPL